VNGYTNVMLVRKCVLRSIFEIDASPVMWDLDDTVAPAFSQVYQNVQVITN